MPDTAPAPHAPYVGRPLDRVDGVAKVTGRARYAAEHAPEGVVHAVVLTATIARGRVAAAETARAEALPGVLAVLTPLDPPRLPAPGAAPTAPYGELDEFAGVTFMGRPTPVLQSREVYHHGQAVGVVVAETPEQARHAASLVRLHYDTPEAPVLAEDAPGAVFTPDALMVPLPVEHRRGDPQAGLAAAEVTVDAEYVTPAEVHNPLEPHATVAAWDGERLTLWDSTQNVHGVQKSVANSLGLPLDAVRVLAPYLGGGFGGKVPVWDHVALAAVAARAVGRPVKLVLARQQMFPLAGHRAHQRQRVRLGATRAGKLTAVSQEMYIETSHRRGFVEHTGEATDGLYECPNVLVAHRGVRLHIPDPCIMRAPGAGPGMFALESAVDELAHALRMDPIELRLLNDPAERDPGSGLPWSSKGLAACYRRGAERFGWSGRTPEPGSLRDGRHLLGWGVATAVYPALRLPCAARARLHAADGRVTVQTAATDIGTGTYTVLTQVAADALGVPPERIAVELGDSGLPWSPGSGGSWGAASFGSAVLEACEALRAEVLALVRDDPASPLRGAGNREIAASDGRLHVAGEPGRGEAYEAILRRHGRAEVAGEATSAPGDAMRRVAMRGFGAQFAEVRIDPDTGEVRVPRFLGVYAVGRLLNPKTARSQMLGGICWGIGAALTEEAVLDRRHGHFVNADLGEYHVPVNADVRGVEVEFLDEEERELSRLGVKGIGEIGIVGVAAAIANAVFHATGRRVRELPVMLDKVV